jgi:hypothetical protein
MRFRWVFLVLIFSLAWTGLGPNQWEPAQAQTDAPQPFSDPPLPLPLDEGLLEPSTLQAETEDQSMETLNAQAFGGLKAVLLVGPIDGDSGDWTTREKKNMELAAQELEAYGVSVHRFYTPENDWEQIKAAAQGAHFLFYRGHGISWSSGPQPVVGGFHLKSGSFSSDAIRRDLRLAPNAIVMMYACFTAGSAGNDVDLSSPEAQRRVAQYSKPFFDLGAAGYYANWHGVSFQYFVRYLFRGMTLGQAYQTFYDFNPNTVERYTHPNYSDLALWLDKDYWNGGTKYDNAFAGRPNETITSLFGVPTRMELSPGTITTFIEPGAQSQSYTVWVDSNTNQSFAWLASAATSSPWMKVTPLTGSSGTYLQIELEPHGLPEGTYSTEVLVEATTPGVEGSVQSVPVTLIYCTPKVIYLPLLVR